MIEARSIVKAYKDTQALKAIDLSVKEGELFGLIGPDGAGKTSLMRILMTLLLPDSGQAHVDGLDVIAQYKEIRKITGYMPGKFALYPDLSVEENLNFFATVFGTTVKQNYELIKEIYTQIEPYKKRKAGKLSGGMKQKLALCCALVHKPKVLILDEPTTGVDAVSRKEFWEMLYSFKKMGLTILVSTPYMDEASLCDRIGLMQDGVMLNTGTPQEICDSYQGDLWAVEASNIKSNKRNIKMDEFTRSVFSFGQALHINTVQGYYTNETIKRLLEASGLKDLNIKQIPATVEDVFIQLMHSNG